MTMVVSLLGNAEDGDTTATLRALVEQGFTRLVRDVVGESQVVEAKREGDEVRCRVLDPAEAAPILADVHETFAKHGSFADFNSQSLDDVLSMAELTFSMDDPPHKPEAVIDSRTVSVNDFAAVFIQTRSNPSVVAKALLTLAKKYRLIIRFS